MSTTHNGIDKLITMLKATGKKYDIEIFYIDIDKYNEVEMHTFHIL